MCNYIRCRTPHLPWRPGFVCSGCSGGDGYDPAGARTSSVFDELYPGAHTDLDEQHLAETTGPII